MDVERFLTAMKVEQTVQEGYVLSLLVFAINVVLFCTSFDKNSIPDCKMRIIDDNNPDLYRFYNYIDPKYRRKLEGSGGKLIPEFAMTSGHARTAFWLSPAALSV